jgi:hypothetical protein
MDWTLTLQDGNARAESSRMRRRPDPAPTHQAEPARRGRAGDRDACWLYHGGATRRAHVLAQAVEPRRGVGSPLAKIVLVEFLVARADAVAKRGLGLCGGDRRSSPQVVLWKRESTSSWLTSGGSGDGSLAAWRPAICRTGAGRNVRAFVELLNPRCKKLHATKRM